MQELNGDGEVSIVIVDPDEEILLYRCLKTACHEICHVLGMTHCPYFECLMNGSNLVTEADKKPFALCPICLRKLDAYCQITNCGGAEKFNGNGLAERYTNLVSLIQDNSNHRFARELALYRDLQDQLLENQPSGTAPGGGGRAGQNSLTKGGGKHAASGSNARSGN